MRVKNLTNEEYLRILQDSVSLRRQGYYGRALELALQLAVDRPDESSVCHTLGQIYTSTGDFYQALGWHRKAVESIESNAMIPRDGKIYRTAVLGLAQALMRFGEFEEAWPYWLTGRLHLSWEPWPGSVVWHGESVGSLLVCCEGGYGDFCMFMRWLPYLKGRAQKVGLMIWEPLEDLIDWSAAGIDQVYVIGRDKIKFGEYAASASIMDLPAFFNARKWDDIVAQTTPDVMIPKPEERPYQEANFRLGFCWRAEEHTSPIKTKSLTRDIAEKIAYGLLKQYKGISIYSLSPDRSDLYDDAVFTQPKSIDYERDKMSSWRATAQYIKSMDLVLTVDTAVAHLAGVLGAPTIVLLPKSSCWRWGLLGETFDGNETAWYGGRTTVFRQSKELDWGFSIRRIVESTSSIMRGNR